MVVRKRDISLDFLKVIGTLMVLNSHMGPAYVKFPFLATGGAIGDALFFFISGFALFLGGGEIPRFDNWYKKRLSRIFPTVLVTAVISCILWDNKLNIVDLLLCRGEGFHNYWFIGCILVYYVLIYPIIKYGKHLLAIFYLTSVIVLACWFIIYSPKYSLFYGVDLIFRKIFYFLLLLEGVVVGKIASKEYRWHHSIMLLLCIIGWYGTVYLTQNKIWQIVSAIPMLGIPYYLYKVGNCLLIKKLFTKMIGRQLLFIIGSLCLECYLVQFYIISDRFNSIFPANIPLIMCLVLIASYIIHSFAEIFKQIFANEPFNWSKVLLRRIF